MIIFYIFLGLIGAVALYALFLTVCALAVHPTREYDRDSRFYRRVLSGVADVVLFFAGVRLHVTGKEKLPRDERFVFVSNHRSNFDPIVQWVALRRFSPTFLSKGENFNIPVIGRLIRPCCFMVIDRENPRNAIKTIRRAAALVEAGEVSVGVYPEGTRSKTGELLPFHNGVFKIAQNAQAPLAVLALSGTETIKKNFPWRRTDVFLTVIEVLPGETIRHRRTEDIGAEVFREINAALGAHPPYPKKEQ